MRPHTERLVDQFPTVAAGLSGEARIDSDHSMSSIFSFGFKDVEERAPGGVQDGFGQMMIFHHRINIEVLNGDLLILLAVRFGYFEVEITALPLDLQMGMRRTPCCLLAPLRAGLRLHTWRCLRLRVFWLVRKNRGFATVLPSESARKTFKPTSMPIAGCEQKAGAWSL